jgi:hypothetical protein
VPQLYQLVVKRRGGVGVAMSEQGLMREDAVAGEL